MAARATVVPPSEACEYEMVLITLPYVNGLGLSGSQTLSAVIGNRAVDDGPAVDAFPGIKHEKEVREPFQHHQPLTLRTIHRSLPG